MTAISPSTGSTARPIPVTISGTGLVAGATVTVDVVAVRVTVVTSTTITAIVPAHAAGPADVVVTNPGGSGGTLPAAFTYSFDGPFTLTPSTNVIDAGGQMSVSGTAPGGRSGDWIAVFRVGASYKVTQLARALQHEESRAGAAEALRGLIDATSSPLKRGSSKSSYRATWRQCSRLRSR